MKTRNRLADADRDWKPMARSLPHPAASMRALADTVETLFSAAGRGARDTLTGSGCLT